MTDIIKLLPDSVANQIAAGEVIQRPSSAVKELLENAIDSGATDIKLIIKEAGRTLIQVTDNGCGMSDTDARMSFERHATSKIRSADDLFAIRTMGFRGEALASIAAIAQIELKTKRTEDELGTSIIIEGSEVKSQEPVHATNGTSISIKNLFYNVPARRNFLKSNPVETRHIIDEFYRIALVNPHIAMSMHHNDKAIFHLNKSNLKQRIVGIFGANYSQRLVPVEQSTENVQITGFIGKPEFARKTRGEQFFFTNKRFIKHPYLHHAIDAAFQELIPKEAFPSYFIYIDVEPKFIDINIHPTKTEINFQDNKMVYAILRSCIRKSLGEYNITPSLDFEVEASLNFTNIPEGKVIKPPTISTNPDYNPFETQKDYKPGSFQRPKTTNWEALFTNNADLTQEKIKTDSTSDGNGQSFIDKIESENKTINEKVFQYKGKYLVTIIQSGVILVDQNRAHERVLFEKFYDELENKEGASQQELFPETITFSASEAEIVMEIKKELETLGFQIEEMNKNTFVFTGRPADLADHNIKDTIEGIIENYRKNLLDLNINKKVNLAQSIAGNLAIKTGKILQKEEQNALIDKLFSCKVPDISPGGKPVFKMISFDEIENMFN